MPPKKPLIPLQENLSVGAFVTGASQVTFRAWAPWVKTLSVEILSSQSELVAMEPRPFGYWETTVSNISGGTQYQFVLHDKLKRPDPASRFQPEGVHGPSEVIDPAIFQWSDQQWKGLPLHDYIIYELHPGTFTPTGTFEAIIPFLSYLRDEVGITAIELMPVAQFPGTRNWGYDGTYLYAPQNSYGGPVGLHRLVDACHSAGLAVILDVVYNHLGPEGNYWGDFGPFFTDHYRTPWGSAINYDGAHSDAVRNIIMGNAVYWTREFHFDALRLDAIHGIFDASVSHILKDIRDAVHAAAEQDGRSVYVIAESDLNDVKLITPSSKGGYNLDAQWNDDFHHALHALVTGERQGYYQDFGTLDHVATAFRKHFVYSGQYSHHRHRKHGNSAAQFLPSQFVVFDQNHDQVGNRAQGDRLSTLIPHEAQQVLIASVLCAPFIPLLFMGEEYGERAPFHYFIDHGDQGLIEAVRKGRLAEFKPFGWKNISDPYAVETFENSRLIAPDARDEAQRHLAAWTRQLIALRKQYPSLGIGPKGHQLRVWENPSKTVLTLYRRIPGEEAMLLILGFNDQPAILSLSQPKGRWTLLLNNGQPEYADPKSNSPLAAPKTLDLTSGKQTLSLPTSPAWIYKQS
ncbi:MAG: malto-oligosyltrehalose trehalohydrolase [Nitrospirales bacterium]|nr:malto-oligosyltrehalose trehalohydrolase [Nitrospirales bacterium]